MCFYCTECNFCFANVDSYVEHTYSRKHRKNVRKNVQRKLENAEAPAPPFAADTGFVIHVPVETTLRSSTWRTEYIILNTYGTRVVVQRSRL